jgi:hypothetical protein
MYARCFSRSTVESSSYQTNGLRYSAFGNVGIALENGRNAANRISEGDIGRIVTLAMYFQCMFMNSKEGQQRDCAERTVKDKNARSDSYRKRQRMHQTKHSARAPG